MNVYLLSIQRMSYWELTSNKLNESCLRMSSNMIMVPLGLRHQCESSGHPCGGPNEAEEPELNKMGNNEEYDPCTAVPYNP